jgi:predicted PurR-regulated permease PerM
MVRTRQYVLAGLLLVLAAISAFVLAAVLRTVIFTITVAYVLYPLRQWFTRRGLSRRVSSALATLTAFVAVVAVFAPIVYVLYRRRDSLIATIRQIPEEIAFTVGEMEYVIETGPMIDTAEDAVVDFAVSLAVAAPRLALELTMFVFLLYGILYKPHVARDAAYGVVPGEYHDVLTRLHERTKTTLYALYLLQAATGFGTFLVAFPLFWALGYQAPATLGAMAGILQFVPVVGPSVLIAALAANDLFVGMPVRAATVAVLGLILVGFAPDAIIRPKLAGVTGDFAPSLYFVGFIGGILTLGAIGVILGPLIVALVVESVEMLSDNGAPKQTPLSEVADSAADGEE